jgi:hypothetical protein
MQGKFMFHLCFHILTRFLYVLRGLADIDGFTICKALDKKLGMHCTCNRTLSDSTVHISFIAACATGEPSTVSKSGVLKSGTRRFKDGAYMPK